MAAQSAKNVLYICPSSGIGGAETFIKNTWLGHNKDIFYPHYLLFSDGPLAQWLSENKASYDILPERPRLSQPWTWISAFKTIRSFVRTRNIQLIHSTMAYGAIFTALSFAKVPHIWFQHGPASGWMDQLAGLLPHKMVLTNSQATTQKQIELEKPIKFLVRFREFRQIHLGVEDSNITETEKGILKKNFLTAYHLPADTRIIGMACRIQKWKGIHHLIEAAEHLVQISPHFHIFVWGEMFGDPEYFNFLKKKSENLPITFANPVPDMRRAFAACDIVVNASIQPEPFGLTLIEAMSVGAVPVAPGWGGPSEFITAGENGLLFTPQTPQDLAKQLSLLIQNNSLCEKLKMNAQKNFLENFTLKNMTSELEACYQDVLSL